MSIPRVWYVPSSWKTNADANNDTFKVNKKIRQREDGKEGEYAVMNLKRK